MSDTALEKITFEQGYEELKDIVSRLDDHELPVHEMFEDFRRGKGLEKALRVYLKEREGELTELEQGKNLPAFEIVAPSDGKEAIARNVNVSVEDRDFQPAPPSNSNAGFDDIPF